MPTKAERFSAIESQRRTVFCALEEVIKTPEWKQAQELMLGLLIMEAEWNKRYPKTPIPERVKGFYYE